MYDAYVEVFFDVYCKFCKYKDCDEASDPCHDCLNEPVNIYSHKPVKWEAKIVNENR